MVRCCCHKVGALSGGTDLSEYVTPKEVGDACSSCIIEPRESILTSSRVPRTHPSVGYSRRLDESHSPFGLPCRDCASTGLGQDRRGLHRRSLFMSHTYGTQLRVGCPLCVLSARNEYLHLNCRAFWNITTSGMSLWGARAPAATTTNNAPETDIEVVEPPSDSISCIAFSPASQGDYLAVGAWDNTVCVFMSDMLFICAVSAALTRSYRLGSHLRDRTPRTESRKSHVLARGTRTRPLLVGRWFETLLLRRRQGGADVRPRHQ
jgi:hypothetical protein